MGFVYLINIEKTDLYKVGITKNTINERLKSLQTGNPLKLIIIDGYESEKYQKIETIIHRSLKHKKYIPEDFENLLGEWFLLSQEDVSNFKSNCKKIEDSIDFLKKHSTLDLKNCL